jgi:hypothetical protein
MRVDGFLMQVSLLLLAARLAVALLVGYSGGSWLSSDSLGSSEYLATHVMDLPAFTGTLAGLMLDRGTPVVPL